MRLLLFLLFLGSHCLAAADVPSQRVGLPLVITDVYLPGSEVKPAPRRDRTPPLVVRLLETKPAQDGYRYDFEITGLDPGTYNLAEFLLTVDRGTPPEREIPIEITSGLPEGIVLPKTTPGSLPELGGYRTTLIVAGTLWLLGGLALLGWKRKSRTDAAAPAAPPSLAEKLRPLVDQAARGELDDAGRARLERLMIGHWKERAPELAALPPAEVLIRLRSHPEASPLLLALERWLHAREATVSDPEIEALLAPYA